MKEEYYEIPLTEKNRKQLEYLREKYKNDTILTSFEKALKENPNDGMYIVREFNEKTKEFGEAKLYSRRDGYEELVKVGNGLAELGLKKGEVVQEYYEPYKSMFAIRLGIFRQGGITTFISGSKVAETEENSEYIKVNPKMIITERSKVDNVLETIKSFLKLTKKKLNLSAIIIISSPRDVLKGKDENVEITKKHLLEELKKINIEGIKVISYENLLELGEKFKHEQVELKPEDPCFYSCASNTTGKGVKISIMSHQLFLMDAHCMDKTLLELTNGEKSSGLAGFTNEKFSDFSTSVVCMQGSRILFISTKGFESYFDDLARFKSNYGFGHPVLFKYYYDIVQASIKKGKSEKEAIEDIKKKLGMDTQKVVVYSGSKLPKNIEEWYNANFHLPLYSVYGCSECYLIAYGDVNLEGKEGAVGDFYLKKLKIKKLEGYPFITDLGDSKIIRGELLIGPPNTFGGYLHDEVKTKNSLNEEGYFYSKDIVEYHTKTGALYLLDRTNDIISLPNGKNVPASFVENSLMGSKYIDQAVIYGDNKDVNLTYICTINKECFDKNTNYDDDNEYHVINNQNVIDEIKNELENVYKLNGFFVHYKHHDLILLSNPWTMNDNLLTNSYKIKRNDVLKKYMPLIEKRRKEEKI